MRKSKLLIVTAMVVAMAAGAGAARAEETAGRDLLLALAAARGGRMAEAARSLEQIAASASDNDIAAAALINLALLRDKTGDAAGRDWYCRELLRRYPSSYLAPDAAQLLGPVTNQRPAAIAVPAAAPSVPLPAPARVTAPQRPTLATPPPAAPVINSGSAEQGNRLIADGITAINGQHYADAIVIFRKAVVLLPDNATACFNLATACYLNGDQPSAEYYFSRTLQIAPNDVEALVYLGIARYQQGKIDMAIADWRRALELEPGHERARSLLATVASSAPQLQR